MLVLAGIVFTSGCTSSNDHNTTNYQNYSGKSMSFQYPIGWTLSENGTPIGNITNDLVVYINKDNYRIDVQVLSLDDPKGDTLNVESIFAIDSGYFFKGIYLDNRTNLSYKVYAGSENSSTIYLFKKGNKTFEIIGDNQTVDVMNKILETIN